MEIAWMAIDSITPYARNARKIPQQAIEKVAASIQEFGWRQPIVVDGQAVIVCRTGTHELVEMGTISHRRADREIERDLRHGPEGEDASLVLPAAESLHFIVPR